MRGRALVLVLAALVVGGCGSSSLSNAELRSQATRICQLAARQTDAVAPPTAPASSAAFLKGGVAVLRPELRALRSLRPPSAAVAEYTTSLTALASQVAALQDTIRDIAAGEDPVIAIKTLQHELAPIEARADGSWSTLEIPACLSS